MLLSLLLLLLLVSPIILSALVAVASCGKIWPTGRRSCSRIVRLSSDSTVEQLQNERLHLQRILRSWLAALIKHHSRNKLTK